MIRWITILTMLLISNVINAQDVYHYLDGDNLHLRWKGKQDASVEGYRIYQKINNNWEKVAETKRLIKNSAIKAVVGPYTELYLKLAGVSTEKGDFTKEIYQTLLSNSEAYNFFGANTILHPTMAKALGEYADFKLKNSELLNFEIRAVSDGKEELFKTYTIADLKKAQMEVLLLPEAEVESNAVKLSWNNSKSRNASILGVRVYRSTSPLGPFVNINPSGFQQFIVSANKEDNQIYIDNYLETGKYYYYVTQFNIFGFESDPSPIKEVVITTQNAVEINDFSAEDKLGMIKLSWKTNAPNSQVYIFRGIQGKAAPQLLYPPSKTIEFTANQYYDRTAEPGVNYVYFLKSTSRTSDTIRFKMVDTRKPEPPTNVKGTVTKNGLARIQWEASTSKNILGYIVERYSGDSGINAFVLNSKPITNSYFEDQLDVKSESAYRYAVKSVNQNYVESQPSELIRLRRPDDIPPKTPVITYVKLTDSLVNLHWTPALESDFHHYVIYRSDAKGAIVRYKTSTQINWQDTVHSSGSYNYSVTAVDGDNNESSRSEAFGVNYTPMYGLMPPTKFVAIDSSSGVFLTWIGTKDAKAVGYIVERQIDGELFPQMIKEIKDLSTAYFDRNIPSGKMVRYFVYAYDSKWNVSETIEVKFKGKK